jgi:hypothetical protein
MSHATVDINNRGKMVLHCYLHIFLARVRTPLDSGPVYQQNLFSIYFSAVSYELVLTNKKYA